MPGQDGNISDNSRPHENEKSTLKKQDIKKNYRNFVSKSLDTENYIKNMLSGPTL